MEYSKHLFYIQKRKQALIKAALESLEDNIHKRLERYLARITWQRDGKERSSEEITESGHTSVRAFKAGIASFADKSLAG